MPDPATSTEYFKSEDAAEAFVRGVEYADNDHVSVEPPYETRGEWAVEVTQFS